MTEGTNHRTKGWTLTAPALVWTSVFFLAPMGMVIAYSLFRRVGASIDTSPSLHNYQRIFDEPVFLEALRNSMEVVLITVVVSILVAYPFAYILAYRVPPRWQRPLLLLAVVPFWTSYVVRSYSWLLVLAKNGVVNQTMLAAGLLSSPITLANTRLATVIGFVHF
ncbi:MAG: ABC transporter permease, partial [Acidimicrobiia bacterium]|nr:ABC transporter permease [Acidimicrobiia bacterium]